MYSPTVVTDPTTPGRSGDVTEQPGHRAEPAGTTATTAPTGEQQPAPDPTAAPGAPREPGEPVATYPGGVLRVPKGQKGAGAFVKGTRPLSLGRKKGSRNLATIQREATAAEELRKSALKAARLVSRQLDDPNPWIAAAAAKTVLERTMPKDSAAGGEQADTGWMEYLTDQELRQLNSVPARAKGRVVPGAIDVEPSGDDYETSAPSRSLPATTTGTPIIDVTPSPDPEPLSVREPEQEFEA